MRIETTGLSNHCSIAGQFSFLFFLFFVFFFLFLGMLRKLIDLAVVLILCLFNNVHCTILYVQNKMVAGCFVIESFPPIQDKS